MTTTDLLGTTQTVSNNISYQPFGAINEMVYGNGLAAEYSIDQDGRLTEQLIATVFNRSYQYDDASNITGMVNNLDINQDQAYQYDSLNRLIDAQGASNNPQLSHKNFTCLNIEINA